MADRFWVNDDVDGLWENANNWSATDGGGGGAGIPTSADVSKFTASDTANCSINTDTPACLGINIAAGYTGTITLDGGGGTPVLDIGTTGYVQAAGTMDLSSGIMECGGNFTKTGGTFTASSATIKFDRTAGASTTVDLNGTIGFAGFEIQTSPRLINITGIAQVSGKTVINGNFNTGTIEASGEVEAASLDISTISVAILKILGSGAQTLHANGGAGAVPNFIVDNTGALTVEDTIHARGESDHDFTVTATSTVDFGTSTIVMNERRPIIDIGSAELYNLTLDIAGRILTVVGTLVVQNDFLIADAATINGGNIKVGRNLTSNDIGILGTTTIELNGTGTQTITVGINRLTDGNLTINKASGSAVLAAALILDTIGQDLIVTLGALDLAGFDLTVNDILDIDDKIRIRGTETITVGTLALDQTASTVEFYGAGEATVQNFATDYFNLQIERGKTINWTAGVGNIVTIKGAWTITGAAGTWTLQSSAVGSQWYVDAQVAPTLGAFGDVKDSNANTGNEIAAIGSTNSGNNDNWDFGAMNGKGFNKFRPNSLAGKGLFANKLG